MGSFSLVHWIIILMIFALPVVVIAVVILAVTRTGKSRPGEGMPAPAVMIRCKTCGALSPEPQPFCGGCGAKL